MLPVELRVAEPVARILYQDLVFRHFRAECGQQVAHDGGVDADVQRFLHGILRQLRASAGEAQVCRGVDEPEQGDGSQHFLFCQGRLCLQGGSGYGLQQVERYGADLQFFQGEGKLNALRHGFAHADDAAAADVHAYATGGSQCAQLLFLRMRGAQGGEVAWGGLQVAVVACHAGVVQCPQVLFAQQSERGAELYGAFPADVAYCFAQSLHVLSRRLPPACHEREAGHALCLIVAGMAQAFVFVQQVVHVGFRVVVCRLCAPLAVFRAASGLGVDDGAHVELL